MRILVTNDDGIHGKGFESLVRALSTLGEVYVVLPDRQRSTTSHSMTLDKPLRAQKLKEKKFLVNGTPSDCVRLGILGLMKEDVELVVAGINNGPNLGDDVTYSGTVGAALEGTLLEIPSFAISLVLTGGYHFEVAANFGRFLAEKIIRQGLPKNVYLNVNVPDLPLEEIEGVEITKQGKRIYGRKIQERTDPRGEKYYWIAGENISGISEEGTDITAIEHNRISITPLSLDRTDYGMVEALKKWNLDWKNTPRGELT
ncbi:MAG: 5'/3'-nucleotidase SurE [Elusimicrobiota bacterium]|nr:5'/3'-nucleotidase SurE [Elusimicrobiota bacterium]